MQTRRTLLRIIAAIAATTPTNTDPMSSTTDDRPDSGTTDEDVILGTLDLPLAEARLVAEEVDEGVKYTLEVNIRVSARWREAQ